MKNLNKKWKTSLYAILMFVCLTGQAWAITLSFEPSTSDISVGDSVDIDIIISGLENNNISGFDFILNYDNAVLNFDSYLFGDGLGDISFFEASDVSLGGDNLAEISWLWDFSFQPDSFTLVSLSFSGVSAGYSDLGISSLILSDDSWPAAATLYATVGTASIDVAAPVPEPTTMVLFATGLASLAGWRKKTRQ